MIEGEQVWNLVREMFEIQASILIHGCTEYKRKRMNKRIDKLAKICRISPDEDTAIWYE